MALSAKQKKRKNPQVDDYLIHAKAWQKELKKLRAIALERPFTEDLKWGKPCYAYEGSNVFIIQSFKAYIALLFFKGVLMKDPKGILEKTGANTRVGRQIRFTGVGEIVEMESVIKRYLNEAIRLEKEGMKVSLKKEKLVLVAEFQKALNKNRVLKAAFSALTPGRQRGYNIYISSAKQSKTREERVKRCVPKILAGKGFQDR